MKGSYCTYMHFEEDRNMRVRDWEKEGRKIEWCRYHYGLGNRTPWSCSKGQHCEWAHDEADIWAFSRLKEKDKKNRVWNKVIMDKGSDDHHDEKQKPAYGRRQPQQSHEKRQHLMAGTRKDGENKAALLLVKKMHLMEKAAKEGAISKELKAQSHECAETPTTLLLRPLSMSGELEARFLMKGEEEAGKKESQAEEGAAAAEVTTETETPHNDVQQLALRRDAVKEVEKEDSGEEEKGMSSTGIIVRSVMHYFSFGKEGPKEAATEVAGPEAEEGAVAVAATEEEATRQSPSS